MAKRIFKEASGVYKMINIISGNFYIGSSKNISKRIGAHRYAIKNKKHDNVRIQEDAIKYGIDSFKFEVLEYCDFKVTHNREQYYFELLNPTYNVWPSVYSARNRSYTSEQLQKFKYLRKPIRDIKAFSEKLKEAWKERRKRPDGIATLQMLNRTGKLHSEETKQEYCIQRKGKPKSQAMKDKLRNTRKGTKLINGRFVKKENGGEL